MIKIGMMIGDRYEILEKIGTGGMSDVYKAKCHKLNRYVAIKVLKQEFSENANFVSKFRIEAQAAAGLMHPNIVNVYDVGEENGIYYIVMELVEGITLKNLPMQDAATTVVPIPSSFLSSLAHFRITVLASSIALRKISDGFFSNEFSISWIIVSTVTFDA